MRREGFGEPGMVSIYRHEMLENVCVNRVKNEVSAFKDWEMVTIEFIDGVECYNALKVRYYN